MIKLLQYPRRIAHWCGTDALKLVMYPPTSNKLWYVRIFLHRVFWRVMWRFFTYHYIDSISLGVDLENFGIPISKIRVIKDNYRWSPRNIPHACTGKFVVLYYSPKSKDSIFKVWLYGLDTILDTKMRFKGDDIEWLKYDGTDDIAPYLRVANVYVRPNRHDGSSVLVRQCEYNNIPVYHTEYEQEASLMEEWLEERHEIWSGNLLFQKQLNYGGDKL
jgi:hypothetical protein